MENNTTISADYFPSIPRTEIIDKSKKRFSIKELENLGGPFALAASAISDISVEHTGQGLYRCMFPEGVTGSLAKFKDGSGVLGTIVNSEGIAGQARWMPANGTSVMFSFDPVTLATGMAMMNVNQKLDKLQKTANDILDFLHDDKESKIEGSVNSLVDILDQYKFNSENELWKSGKLTVVTDIKSKAESGIIFYRKQITKDLEEKQQFFHGFITADKLKEKLNHDFKLYQLSLYLYAQASFLEVLLGGNYKEDFLNHVSEKIRAYGLQYREDYSAAYDAFDQYLKGNFEHKIKDGLGDASQFLGEAIGKIPKIKEGPVDEALISAGDAIKKFNSEGSEKAMEDFGKNAGAGISLFLDNIDEINEVCNKPVELYFDEENLYLL